MTAGGAAGDFNADGYADLYVIGGGDRADALYINNGDGTFTDKSEEWNLDTPHRGVGATTGDYDNDGDLDLYVTSFGPMSQNAGHGQHLLYRNEGDHFVNVAQDAGVATTTTTHPDGYGAAFGDYDATAISTCSWVHGTARRCLVHACSTTRATARLLTQPIRLASSRTALAHSAQSG